MTLRPGEFVEVIHVVTNADSAKLLRTATGDDFPDVLATSRMIALMELAAARLMQPLFGVGELSVGVGVDVEHLAATPLHETVTAKATYLGAVRKLHSFAVEVFDAGGMVGRGTHTRVVVVPERLIERAHARIREARDRT